MADIVREPVPITAYDAPDGNALRIFFLLPWSFVTDAELSEADDGTVRVAIYRRVLRATSEDQNDEVDGAFLTVGSLRFDLKTPLADRPVLDANTGNPIATLDGAAKRGPFRTDLLDARNDATPRWRFA